MRYPKIYGSSRVTKCPFCQNHATVRNSQGMFVCERHKAKKIPEIRCACGDWLELKGGKFGVFFLCPRCGCISMNKGLVLMKMQQEGKEEKQDAVPVEKSSAQSKNIELNPKNEKKEIVVRSDDPDYC